MYASFDLTFVLNNSRASIYRDLLFETFDKLAEPSAGDSDEHMLRKLRYVSSVSIDSLLAYECSLTVSYDDALDQVLSACLR